MSIARRAAVVCLAVVTSLATVFVSRAAASTEPPPEPRGTHLVLDTKTPRNDDARGHHSAAPILLRDGLVAYPPATGLGITTVYLHGVNGRPETGCPWFRAGASELGWLVCPEGVKRDANGTASWGGDVFAQGAAVSHALDAAGGSEAVAIGFSQGGYVALDLVKTHRARFRGLVLIAAPEAHPSAAKLREAGVVRVALAAGQLDAAYAPLALDAKRLEREGIEARFYDLGRIGHTYAAEDTSALRDAITWAGGSE